MLNEGVSVILPVYNGERFIEEAISSILTQTHSNLELIIINDGSTDRTLDLIVDNFDDERLKVFTTENQGIVGALNFGIEKARYQYIVRMDADDVSLPTRIECQLSYMIDNNLDVVGCNIYTINEKGNSVGSVDYPESNNKILSALPFFNPICHPSVIIRKSLFDKEGGYLQGFEGAEDFELWCRLSKNYLFGNCQNYLLKYRLTSGSLSRTSFFNRIEKCRKSLNINLDLHFDVFYQPAKYFVQLPSIFNYCYKRSKETSYAVWIYSVLGLLKSIKQKLYLIKGDL